MKYLMFFAFSLLLLSGNAAAVGFSAGAAFTATPLAGNISVHCRDGDQSDTAFHACHEEILEPVEASYFLGTEGVAASRVELTAHYEDGNMRAKDLRYNAATGRSEAVNLWIATLFQRPLLDYGQNRIEYVMRDGQGSTMSKGEFLVQVNRGDRRRCRSRTYWSNSMSDCRSPGFLCSRYFRDEDYCR